MSSPIHAEARGPVFEVTIDRPKANALDASTSRIMGETFARFRDDPSLRVAILTAAGEKFFCPGWDLKAAAEGETPDSDYGAGSLAQHLAGGPPLVFAAAKQTVRATMHLSIQQAFDMVTKRKLKTVDVLDGSEDQIEGAQAFAEKREPVWKGR